ncbi:DNA repair protein RadA, partial [Corynebacterium sp. 35RC1]|nr:DNA repair protein RadA [Corynebacterium sp. 35RC1]
MAKKPQHTCTECGYTSPKWLGRCPECGAWGSMEQGAPTPASVSKVGVLTPTSPA